MGLGISGLHHVAIICTDQERSQSFYTGILGFEVLQKTYRAERDSYKIDLGLQGKYLIELFSFPKPPQRLSRPEAVGLRHLAFAVDDIDRSVAFLSEKGIAHEAIRVDELTGKRFVFFADPDGLPLELYSK